MADASLEARLKSHAKAFEGLMSLIPANVYYGEDNSDQWQRKKQTKEQKRAAKKAKLDPVSYKSALDVQNERKRKREEEAVETADGDVGEPAPKPQAVSTPSKKPLKKQKANDGSAVAGSTITDDGPVSAEEAARRQAIADKRKEKRARKNERDAKEREKRERGKEAKQKAKADAKDGDGEDTPADTADSTLKQRPSKSKQNVKDGKAKQADKKSKQKQQPNRPVAAKKDEESDAHSDEDAMEIGEDELLKLNNMDPGKLDVVDEDDGIVEDEDAASVAEHKAGDDEEMNGPSDDNDEEDITVTEANDLAPVDLQGLVDEDEAAASDTSSSADETPTFDHSHQSSISSASSIQPDTASTLKAAPTTDDAEDPESTENSTTQRVSKPTKLPKIDPVLLQERLQARLTALRAARNADGVDGKPAKNRQELIEARRRKDENRKAHKKELRAKARQEERDAEGEAKRLRGGSGSPMLSPGTFSPVGEEYEFSFGRVAFDDGTAMDPNLSTVLPARKKKGPQDPKTALEAVAKKNARISGLDAEKRADIEEKDRWLNAKKRIHGERIRDDTSLLKKTLKRKEKVKAKSEREWGERGEGVQKGKEMRQKKREDNLKKRREEKGGNRGKVKGKPAVKPKKRPGFEGSFKSGGGKKA